MSAPKKDWMSSPANLETLLNRTRSTTVKNGMRIAKEAHGETIRKNADELYIAHAFRVGLILHQLRANEYVIAAGILHGVLEHTRWSKEDLAGHLNEHFGPETVKKILAHVAAVTEYFERKNMPWDERKEKFLKCQSTMPRDVLLIVFADKLDILKSLVADFQRRGADMWQPLTPAEIASRREHYTDMHRLFVKCFTPKEEARQFLKEYGSLLGVLFPITPI